MAIRKRGLGDVSEVSLGVLKSDGTVSIVPKDSARSGPHRRVVRCTHHR